MDKKTTQFLIDVGKSAPRDLVKKAAFGDQKAGTEVNKFWEAKIEKGIKSGEIPRAKPDEFTRMVKDHMKK